MNQKKRIYVQTLGCPKNIVRTQDFYKSLDYANNEVVYSPDDADVIILNTCGFIADAVKESVVNALELREQYPDKEIVFAGCVPLRFGTDTVSKELPEMNAVIKGMDVNSFVTKAKNMDGSILTFPYAYVSIAEGCNGTCSYCTIPKFWGPLQSKSIKDILDELNTLTDIGIKEVVLVSQDSGAWGTDLYGKPSLSMLIDALRDTDIPWLRIMYVNPSYINEALLSKWRDNGRILPYFDIPLQSGSDRLLKLMHRGYSRSKALESLKLVDEVFPENVKRTSLIAGFPTESEDDLKNTIDLIIEGKLNHVGVFAYSDEEEAPSYQLPQKLSEEEIQQHKNVLENVALQLQVAWERTHIGKSVLCLVEACSDGSFVGRMWGQAPEIDGIVVAQGNAEPGEMVEVVVEKAEPGVLIGHKKGEKDNNFS
ncbi:MiaB/RimO family radical SAM methylthiotransferase [Coprothermobacter platensis]|uniref:MiaB/RimO family radical SAM methylthiotransferase n=1 Tax=Coprothermobacter platensis TaxID=108819 RepID=UPI0003793030|nr:MiaB/RimO family radical SAM methylthiotransferase [Coprothermobacter platensis]